MLKYQDYSVTEKIIFQDNRSTLFLEKNGNASSGKIMKHTNISFSVTNRIQKGEISVEWCPTNDMNGDLFTNPNQESLF